METTTMPSFELGYLEGYVAITFDKGEADAVNIYRRIEGGDWQFLATDTFSPYVDTEPVMRSGLPEDRDYKLVPVVSGAEAGAESEVKTILLGG